MSPSYIIQSLVQRPRFVAVSLSNRSFFFCIGLVSAQGEFELDRAVVSQVDKLSSEHLNTRKIFLFVYC